MRLYCYSRNISTIIRHQYRNIFSKISQLETSKMSNLKVTPLQDINATTFDLFQTLTKTDEIQYLHELFKNDGFEIRMAGGAVRDLLCQTVPHDIDFASDAKPDDMIKILEDKPNIRLITSASGIKHGTVTARINNVAQYEITTLRIDANTDGRHAEVEFVNDWKIDASRRDLTINSMFIDLDGILYDYFGGESDLKTKTIRFVGDPETRIQEDYLRILRYFRFHIRFGISGVHDERTLSAIKKNMAGLDTISGERIWSETKKILCNSLCENAVEIMFNHLNFGRYLRFDDNFQPVDLDEFRKVRRNLSKYSKNEELKFKPETLFASLIKDVDQLSPICLRLRLSNMERDLILFILTNRHVGDGVSPQKLRKQLATTPGPDQPNLQKFIVQYLMYKGVDEHVVQHIQEWVIPKFPFSAKMIDSSTIKKKEELRILLQRLKHVWAENDFKMTEQQFKNEIDEYLRQQADKRSTTSE